MWKDGKTTQVSKHDAYMSRIGEIFPTALQYLATIPVERWTLSHDSSVHYSQTTTNMLEGFNGNIRRARFFPITAMMEYLFYKVVAKLPSQANPYAGLVDVDDFILKMKKSKGKIDVDDSDKVVPKSAASRTRSRLMIKPIINPSISVLSLSSESRESPKDEGKNIEMSSGRIYAKEFKPPVIKPLLMTSRELFKIAYEDKPPETESSKAPILPSPNFSPLSKKVKTDPSSLTTLGITDSFLTLVTYKFDVDAKASSFGHLLSDMLLPQNLEVQSTKSISRVLDEASCHAFHVLQNTMAARENFENELKRFNQIELEHKNCPEKLRAALERAAENLKMAKEIRREFDEFTTKVQFLESEMRDEAAKLVTQQSMHTLVDMMLEYSCGGWKSWNVVDTMKIYNDFYPEDAFQVEIPVDQKLKSPKDVEHVEDISKSADGAVPGDV
ncbi:uncharacterized protein LOC141691070 [Apium graveolens]|uniref:uncharacterized protein LOC141691070 n=1 Tax=Apium graveolens TaxID=4045 RepID=UPI003D7B117F